MLGSTIHSFLICVKSGPILPAPSAPPDENIRSVPRLIIILSSKRFLALTEFRGNKLAHRPLMKTEALVKMSYEQAIHPGTKFPLAFSRKTRYNIPCH